LANDRRLAEAEQVLAMLKEQEQFEFVRSDPASDPRTTTASMTADERGLAEGLDAGARRLSEIHAQIARLREWKELSAAERRSTLARLNEQLTAENEKVLERLKEIQQTLAGRKPPDKTLEILAASRGATSGTLSKLSRDTGMRPALVYFLPSANATGKGLLALHAGLGEKALNARIATLREGIERRDDSYQTSAADLYDALIRPLEPYLTQAQVSTVMLYLTDALRYLPFAALYDRDTGSHLAEKYGLAIYTQVGRENLKDPPATRWSAVALGTRRKIGKHDPLPAVDYELARVVRDPRDEKPQGILEGERHLDEEFSREVFETLLGAGASFPVMHIATHFLLAPGNDDRSALLLGDGEEMTLREIRARAQMSGYELVTLSACDTAIGGGVLSPAADGVGAEVEGLGATLQQQGAKSVLATLWKVQDAGTARLMEEFYKTRGEDRRTTKAEALRQAQLALLRGEVKADNPNIDLTHPHYWAPFVLMGNWM
jgi:CHAT domain-containing protein